MATIVDLLKKVHEGPDKPKCGICSQRGIIELETPAFELLKEVMAKWPKSSGSRLYPVPSPDPESPSVAYYTHNDLWNKNTEYGRLRWELLDWLSPENYARMKAAMREWPKYSGCRVYPVPTRTDVPSAALAQMAYMRENNRSLWDAGTEYGRLRWELLDWLIKHPDMQKPLWKRV